MTRKITVAVTTEPKPKQAGWIRGERAKPVNTQANHVGTMMQRENPI